MAFKLTDQQHVMLELIAEGPVPAIPEIDHCIGALEVTELITLMDDVEWQITRLGEAMLERLQHTLH
jgi:hypothetical protein